MNEEITRPEKDINSFGYKMYKLRVSQNLGQKELAKHLHVSVSTISNYENNVHEPDLPTLAKIADYLNTSVDYLLNRTSYLYPMSYLEQQLIQNYSCSDILNTIIQLTKHSRTDLVGYLDMLNLRDNAQHTSAPIKHHSRLVKKAVKK